MAIWRPAPVAKEPELTLVSWRVMQTEVGECHFVGIRPDHLTGRVSSPIHRLDMKSLVGVTSNGRVYRLVGPPQWSDHARYTWERWCEMYQVSEWRDVTDELLAALVPRHHCPDDEGSKG
ncbi:hypothetical protein QF001_008450 [Paraburkholderia youngii]